MAKKLRSGVESQGDSRKVHPAATRKAAMAGKFTNPKSYGAVKSSTVAEGSSVHRKPIIRQAKGTVEVGPSRYAKAGEIILTGRPEFQLTPIEKMNLAEEGISKKALEKLKEKSGLDYDQLSQLLNVSRTTLISTKGNTKFSTDISDKILGLADVYSYGYEVFEDRDRFNEWIFRPNKALGGQAPFDLLHNSFGKEEVKNLIGRIDYGIYS